MQIPLLLIVLISLHVVMGQYTPDWPSLNSRPTPQWYDDAKFGIFIHWGVYSVPAWSPVGTYAEWYWFNLENDIKHGGGPFTEFHDRVYGNNFHYQNFASMFKAELFNVTFWGEIFEQSGAKYIVPTSKHHEGFTLWNSLQAWNWNAVDIGPQQDLLGAIMNETKRRGLHQALYFSLFEWFNTIYRGPDPKQYVLQVMLPQMFDLINNYQPEYLFTDGSWEHYPDFWNSTEFLTWLFNDSPVKDTIAINDRWGKDTGGRDGGVFTSEYNNQIWWDHKWEENSGLDIFSFGYNRNSKVGNYSSAREAIQLLIRTVAYGGNLLLDIGPTHDGRIPTIMQERLLQIGDWLRINGDSIYSTKPWNVRSENASGIPVFYTRKSNSVYATFWNWPDSNTLLLKLPQPSSQTEISFLGYGTVSFTRDQNGVNIRLPNFNPTNAPSPYAWTLELTHLSNNFPSIVPVQNFWSSKNTDNAPVVNQSQITRYNDLYTAARYEGLLLFQNASSNVDELNLYYSEANLDFAAAIDINQLSTGYTLVGHLGYVSKTQLLGYVPLDLFWSATRKDYYLVGSDESYIDAHDNGYKFVARQGFVYPGPFYFPIYHGHVVI